MMYRMYITQWHKQIIKDDKYDNWKENKCIKNR